MPEFGSWLARRWRRRGRREPARRRARPLLDVRAPRRCGPRARTGVPVVQTFHALGVVKRRHQGAADTSPPDRLAREEHLARHADAVIATCSDEVRRAARARRGPGEDPHRALRRRPRRVPPRAVAAGPARSAGRCGGSSRSAGSSSARASHTLVEALPHVPDAELVVAGGPDERELDADPHVRALRAAAARARRRRPGPVRRPGRAGRRPRAHALRRRRRRRALVRAVRHRAAGGDGLRRPRRGVRRRRAARHRRPRRHRPARPARATRPPRPRALRTVLGDDDLRVPPRPRRRRARRRPLRVAARRRTHRGRLRARLVVRHPAGNRPDGPSKGLWHDPRVRRPSPAPAAAAPRPRRPRAPGRRSSSAGAPSWRAVLGGGGRLLAAGNGGCAARGAAPDRRARRAGSRPRTAGRSRRSRCPPRPPASPRSATTSASSTPSPARCRRTAGPATCSCC